MYPASIWIFIFNLFILFVYFILQYNLQNVNELFLSSQKSIYLHSLIPLKHWNKLPNILTINIIYRRVKNISYTSSHTFKKKNPKNFKRQDNPTQLNNACTNSKFFKSFHSFPLSLYRLYRVNQRSKRIATSTSPSKWRGGEGGLTRRRHVCEV